MPAPLGRPVPEPSARDPVEAALLAEEQFVRTLGGFVLGIAGADLVTHEKIPIARFNYVLVHAVAPGRRTAFFERALDHYFQRAIRPTFRVPTPVPAHVDGGLRAVGFRPNPSPLALLLSGGTVQGASAPGLEVRPAAPGEFDAALALWTGERERPEFRMAMEIVWHDPNPGERLTPMVATRDGQVVSAGIRYEVGAATGLHFISTSPRERGQGAASALVRGVFGDADPVGRNGGFLSADSPRLVARLVRLGFLPGREFTVYELPRDAELAFPRLPPAGLPPRWRPPRSNRGRRPEQPTG